MAHRAKIAAAFVLFSCGGSPPSQEPHPLPSASASAPVAPRRRPTEALAKHVAEGAKLFAYADLEGLFATQLGRGLAPNFSKLAGGDVGKCIDALASAGKEILYSSGAGDTVVAVRFDPAKMSPSACPINVVEPGIGVFGDGNAHARLPDELALDRDEYVRAYYVDKPVLAHVSLAMTDALFALHADADLPEERAKEAAAMFEKQRAMLPAAMNDMTPEERDAVGRLLLSTKFRRDGSHVALAVDLHESPVDQARDIGMMSALAIHGVRKYLLQSKEAEARNAVPQIARNIAASWERETLPPTPRAKKKLQSFPAIPPTVPRGTKYQPSEKEWATWSAIKFEMDQPLYYQYEVRAAKDGESADVIARGDLNGDGKTSSFVITIKVRKDKDRTLDISPIVETDPDE